MSCNRYIVYYIEITNVGYALPKLLCHVIHNQDLKEIYIMSSVAVVKTIEYAWTEN